MVTLLNPKLLSMVLYSSSFTSMIFLMQSLSNLDLLRVTVIETKCNTQLNHLKNWCYANKLQINFKKCNVLLIPSKLNSPPLNLEIGLYYDNSLIACGESCKHLGIKLDSKLLFKNHIKQIEVKVAKGVGILSKLNPLFSFYVMILFIRILANMLSPSGVAPIKNILKNSRPCGLYAIATDFLLLHLFISNWAF